jgi:SAM-dependent methyltransferase
VGRVRGRRERDPLALSPEDRRYLTEYYDASVPLPPGAAEELSERNPRLRELRSTYAGLELPASDGSRWQRESIDAFLDLRYFRGETLITWHYRELPRITRLKYFVLMRYVAQRDAHDLLERLGEDGAFGCWTYSYPGYGRVSRDLLESVNEISFLERELRLSERERFSVLDIGAGYGRLAHRMATAYPNLSDYCCADAIPESTFLSEYYLGYRGCAPPARVVSLDAVDGLAPGGFDLAVNIHSFSECTLAAIAWWVEQVRRLQVPRLLVVPNEPTDLLSLEVDGTRRDFAPLLEDAGYRLVLREPVVDDPAVRELVPLEDHFHLFRLAEGE